MIRVRVRTEIVGTSRISSMRYVDIASSSDSPRTTRVTDAAFCEKYMAAWPALLAPPTM